MKPGSNRTLGAGDEAGGMRLLAGFETSVEGLGGRGAAGIIVTAALTAVSRAVAAAVAGGGSGSTGGGSSGGGADRL